MPLIRSDRADRRRRVMREAVAADAEVAVESVRARQRRRTRDRDQSDDDATVIKRDPGYSQAVRRACQQRLVQLIPVRRSRLVFAVTTCWIGWLLLLLAHYLVHVQPIAGKVTAPIAFLVHLRSTHGIAHWLGGQLWMLTALAALMIFQLRRHKLDDYQARYRVWGLLSLAALISSFDVSSSGLYLLGLTIDGWAQREVGYSGWAIVLATFATLVGLLGLRICSEIKSAPMSVVFWLAGLVAWAVSAVVGTKLIDSPWNPAMTDMLVGATWLGGILAVFLSAGIYLRHIYIQAQKRFILRNRMLQPGTAWRLPRFARRDREQEEPSEDPETSKHPDSSSLSSSEENEREDDAKRSWLRWKRRAAPSESDEMPKRRWLRVPRWNSDPKLGEDYSDVAAERRKRDEGFEEPYGKKRGWFSRKANDEHRSANDDESESRVRSSVKSREQPDESTPDFQEVTPARSSWWKRNKPAATSDKRSSKPGREDSARDEAATGKTKRRWFQRSSKPRSESTQEEAAPKNKRNWSLLRKKSTTESNATKPPPKPEKSGNAKPKRRFFSFLDSLKLKPPVEPKSKNEPVAVNSNRASIPSSSAAQRHEPPKPSAGYPDNRNANAYDEDDFDDDSTRNLSKAERKRLRRQQQENRRAA